MQLLEEFADLGVEFGGGVEDEALEHEADGVEGRGNDQHEEPGEQAEACAKTGGDARLAEAGAVHAEDDDWGGTNQKKESSVTAGRAKESNAKAAARAAASPAHWMAPRQTIAWLGVAGCGTASASWVCGRVLGTNLLIDLIAQFFGELYLRGSAVPAIDEGAFLFAMK